MNLILRLLHDLIPYILALLLLLWVARYDWWYQSAWRLVPALAIGLSVYVVAQVWWLR